MCVCTRAAKSTRSRHACKYSPCMVHLWRRLTCDGRRFDDGGGPEEGGYVAGGGDGGVEVAGLGFGDSRLVGGRAGGRWDGAAAGVDGGGDALVEARVEAEHVEVVRRGRGRRLGEQEGGVVMVMVMVLCGQRVQAVHDHGGRRVGKTRRGPAYHRTRACSAGTHYTGVLVTTRVEGEPVTRHPTGSFSVKDTRRLTNNLLARELLRNWSRRERYFTFMNGVSVPYLEVANKGRANRRARPLHPVPTAGERNVT
jgi:hypothetical protein